jgi:hypothetical protein
LSVILFFLPLQCFVIGDNMGIGVQGAVYRYQITTNGNSLIPVTTEVTYVTSGLITGKTANSILFWIAGTVFLIILTFLSFLKYEYFNSRSIQLLSIGLFGASICHLLSCSIQYGPFLQGPAGRSLPAGVVLTILFSIFIYVYREWFLSGVRTSSGENEKETIKLNPVTED